MQFQQKITPFLSYLDRAEEAANFYVSVLPNSKLLSSTRHPETSAVLTVEFELCGMNFVALNAGSDWKFTQATSLAVWCENQEEIDRLWAGLSADGGAENVCGWLQDKFGMSWQICPAQLQGWLASGNEQGLQRMFEAVWRMKKLDVAALQNAFDGGT